MNYWTVVPFPTEQLAETYLRGWVERDGYHGVVLPETATMNAMYLAAKIGTTPPQETLACNYEAAQPTHPSQ